MSKKRAVDMSPDIEALEEMEKTPKKPTSKKKEKNVVVANEEESTPTAPAETAVETTEQSAPVADTQESKKKTSKKPKKIRGKKYKTARKSYDKTLAYSIDDAVKAVRKAAFAKFTETVELHVNLGIDPKNTDQRIRFTASLPFGVGKSVRVLVLSDDNSGKKESVIYRDASAIDEIIAGKLIPQKDFDMVVATPALMKDLTKAARILGPKGMMPSPKNNTVTENVAKAVESLAGGQMEIKSQAGYAVLHQIVGNLSFKDEQLIANISYLLGELNKNTPAKMKKKLIQKITLCSSMSPSVRINY